jgi:hypothetical protein
MALLSHKRTLIILKNYAFLACQKLLKYIPSVKIDQ